MTSPLIFIVGPTGVGKSDLAFALAKRYQGELINADAMQVYKEINIASDKPTFQMRQLIKHHVIDVVSVTQVFDVAQYRQWALQAIDDCLSRGKQPIVVGGSGMYVNVLLDGIFEQPASDPVLRARLLEQASQEGAAVLHQQLTLLDPKAAAKIHPHDAKRIVRALEVHAATGQAISVLQANRQGLWGHKPISIVGLTRLREQLYERVEKRVEVMFENGLVEEIKSISDLPLSRTAATLIGIPEVINYLKGQYDLDQAKYLMKLNTRHFVKRQLTWFRRDQRIQWINMADYGSLDEVMNLPLFGKNLS